MKRHVKKILLFYSLFLLLCVVNYFPQIFIFLFIGNYSTININELELLFQNDNISITTDLNSSDSFYRHNEFYIAQIKIKLNQSNLNEFTFVNVPKSKSQIILGNFDFDKRQELYFYSPKGFDNNVIDFNNNNLPYFRTINTNSIFHKFFYYRNSFLGTMFLIESSILISFILGTILTLVYFLFILFGKSFKKKSKPASYNSA
jgi:hypothetical protein